MSKSKKIVVLGHFGVGKTSLIRRFVSNSFSDKYLVSIGVHITKKVVEISPTESLSFVIWDLEGTDEIDTIRDAYLLGTHGALFVFDVSRPSTFQNLKEDLKIVTAKMPKVPVLIIGNKIDLVVEKELKELLKEHNIDYNFLTSAKTGSTVDTAFLELAKELNV
ncbi:Rab family GTPase [uncultured Maribacter sp.]|uniref:Rab family GTPase n=1 Tax=uncultured Maribacter sp. TaxID=431308 RepID=UPI00263785F2|nr:Rab family GTPase [uncultured Maribacter sp.]